jgi:hypothetical protein
MHFFFQLYFSILLRYLLLCIILVYDKLNILWVSALYGSDECSINTILHSPKTQQSVCVFFFLQHSAFGKICSAEQFIV